MFYTIVGTQWGDEGKGKIVDWLSSKADFVVRFQGGNNAGHTIKVDKNVYKLNLLPSGIIRNKKCMIGNGVILDPWALKNEISNLRNQKININNNNLFIAENVCLILPIHKLIDEIDEESRGNNLIGTTKKGVRCTKKRQSNKKYCKIHQPKHQVDETKKTKKGQSSFYI